MFFLNVINNTSVGCWYVIERTTDRKHEIARGCGLLGTDVLIWVIRTAGFSSAMLVGGVSSFIAPPLSGLLHRQKCIGSPHQFWKSGWMPLYPSLLLVVLTKGITTGFSIVNKILLIEAVINYCTGWCEQQHLIASCSYFAAVTAPHPNQWQHNGVVCSPRHRCHTHPINCWNM